MTRYPSDAPIMPDVEKELGEIREAARRAIAPIKPADASTQADANFLFTAKRTNASHSLPPYYLVYFLLVELLGFRNLGRFEKLAWSVPIDLDGMAYLIEHRKFGVGVFARAEESEEQQARRIVALIKKGVKAAKPFFKCMADDAVRASKLNVRNVSNKLFERYIFFRDGFSTATAEAQALKNIHETEQQQRQFSFHPYSVRNRNANIKGRVALFTFPWIRKSEDASWLALAAVEAFFGWTEHIFIHLAILQGHVTTGAEVAQMAESDWSTKFKSALDVSDKATKEHFDKLVTIRRQLRNFMAHGAFGKEGEAFSFHSGAGAVPVVLDHRPAKTQFSLTPELAFDDEEALATIEKFIAYLWSGQRKPAQIYIQESSLPLILPKASDGTYAAAMASVNDMQDFVDHLSKQRDDAGNMDW
jgi:hypothetical protein